MACDCQVCAVQQSGQGPEFRDPQCVKVWPECQPGLYDPRCCRFPKSCSCGGYLSSPEDMAVAMGETPWRPDDEDLIIRLAGREQVQVMWQEQDGREVILTFKVVRQLALAEIKREVAKFRKAVQAAGT